MFWATHKGHIASLSSAMGPTLDLSSPTQHCAFYCPEKIVPGMTALEPGVWGWKEMSGLGRSPSWGLCAVRGREYCTEDLRLHPLYLRLCPQEASFQRMFNFQYSQVDSGGSQR